MIAKAACLFPYTNITPVRLSRVLQFFKEIILYRLPLDQPPDYLAAAADKGLVIFKEVSFIEDPAEIRRILDDFSRWADLYQDPAYLSLLRRRAGEDVEDSGARLMAGIRGRGLEQAVRRDPRREAQVFLHFARDLDRRNEEINEILTEVEKSESSLGDILGVEEAEELGAEGLQASPAGPHGEPGGEMMPQRLAAWGRFYQAFGQRGLPLVTDRAEAAAELDLNLARTLKRPELVMAGTTEVLEPFVTLTRAGPAEALPFERIEAGRQELSGWFDFIDRVASRGWSSEELSGLREEARDLAASSGADSAGSEGPRLTLTGYLLPGADLKKAFLSAAGIESAPMDRSVFSGPLFELRPT